MIYISQFFLAAIEKKISKVVYDWPRYRLSIWNKQNKIKPTKIWMND